MSVVSVAAEEEEDLVVMVLGGGVPTLVAVGESKVSPTSSSDLVVVSC